MMEQAFTVLMESDKSAREDLKAIMAGVKAINKQKEGWRAIANTLAAYPAEAGKPSRGGWVFDSTDAKGATVTGGFTLKGTGAGGAVTRADVESARETIKNKLDSLSEMGEMESLRLQMAMDRMSKMMSTLSNLLKKMSDTASEITQNLK